MVGRRATLLPGSRADEQVLSAAGAGRLPHLKAALDDGGSPNVLDFCGDPSLLLACRGRHAACAALLLRRGADPGAQGSRGETAVMVAVQLSCTQLLEVVLAPGVDLATKSDGGLTAFQFACLDGRPPALLERLLLHYHAQLRPKSADNIPHGQPAEHSTAPIEMPCSTQQDWEAGRPLVLAMYAAVASGNASCLQLLVHNPLARAAYAAQFGAIAEPPAAANDGGLTASEEQLPTAASGSGSLATQAEQLHALPQQGMEQQLPQQPSQRQQAQRRAYSSTKAEEQQLQEELGFLLDADVVGPANSLTTSFLWQTGGLPCHLAAAINQPDCLHMLLTAGLGSADEPTAEGFTPLMLAATADATAAVAVLLRGGADLEARNSASRTALFLAATSGSPATLEMLVKARADVNAVEQARLCSPIIAAVSRAAALEASRHPKAPAFQRCVELLIAAGADVHQPAKDGSTALHAAAEGGSLRCIDLLLEAGAELDVVDAAGRTPLAGAAAGRAPHPRCVLHLLAKGAAVGSSDVASNILTSLLNATEIGTGDSACADEVATVWRLLSLLDARQLRALSSCPKFYELPHTEAPAQALAPAAVASMLELACEGCANLLYNVSAADNASHGRRPAYLFELLRRAASVQDEDDKGMAFSADLVEKCNGMGMADGKAPAVDSNGNGMVDSGMNTDSMGSSASTGLDVSMEENFMVEGCAAEEMRALVAGSPHVAKLLTMWTSAQMLLQYASCIAGCHGVPQRDREQLACRVGHLFSSYHALAGLCSTLGLSLSAGLEHPHAPLAATSAVASHRQFPLLAAADGLASQEERAIGAALRPFGDSIDDMVGCIADQTQLRSWHFVLEYRQVASLACKQRLLQNLAAAWPRRRERMLALATGRRGVLQRVCSAAEEQQAQRGERSVGGALWHGIKVAFDQENGAGDGVRREWFRLLAAELTNPDTGLFESHNGGATFSPAPHASLQCDVHSGGGSHLQKFELVGCMIGLAILQGCTLPGFSLTSATWRLVLGQPPQPVADLEAADPLLHRNLQLLGDMGPAVGDLGLHFEVHDALGRGVELCPGGGSQLVTAGNVDQYILALAQYKQVSCMAAEAGALGKGLRGVLTGGVVDCLARCFGHAELEAMVAGLAELSPAEWQAHTRLEHCRPYSPQLRWLWDAIRGMTPEQRRQLLAFVTSSSTLPAGGFAALRGFNGALHPFTVSLVATEGDERLPRASTCFNTLFLPAYTSPGVLERRLLQAISGEQAFDEGVIRR